AAAEEKASRPAAPRPTPVSRAAALFSEDETPRTSEVKPTAESLFGPDTPTSQADEPVFTAAQVLGEDTEQESGNQESAIRSQEEPAGEEAKAEEVARPEESPTP